MDELIPYSIYYQKHQLLPSLFSRRGRSHPAISDLPPYLNCELKRCLNHGVTRLIQEEVSSLI